MTGSLQRRIKRGTILIYWTLLLAVGQSTLLHLGTTDYAHRIISTYFIIETLILGVTLIGGLKNKWTRRVLVVLTALETVLFIQDTPISPDHILMIMAWCIRVYVIAGLYTESMNQYYRTNFQRRQMAKPLPLRSLAILLFLVLIVSCSPKDRIEVENYKGISIPKDSVDKYFESRMEELNIPGLSFAIINDGEVVHHKAIGFSDLEENIPVTNETIFEGASLSKSLFAFFVMTYVEEDRLELDKPLFEYLPYTDIAYDDRYKKITARMVLSHRSGFPNWRENEDDRKLKIKFEPGTGYEYSGEGYQYLAMVLKHIEGTDWNVKSS